MRGNNVVSAAFQRSAGQSKKVQWVNFQRVYITCCYYGPIIHLKKTMGRSIIREKFKTPPKSLSFSFECVYCKYFMSRVFKYSALSNTDRILKTKFFKINNANTLQQHTLLNFLFLSISRHNFHNSYLYYPSLSRKNTS